MNLQEKAAQGLCLGVYLHVPFCLDTCDFCAFYQEKPTGGIISDYLDCLETESECYRDSVTADTFFWGGGTPSILNPREMQAAAKALTSVFGQPQEWTVEVAPMLVSEEKIRLLLDLGVNRFSMGVQSFDEALLKSLGRQHSAKHILRAYETMRHCGCDNINLDLIFSIPGQSVERLEKDLEQAVALNPEHLSTYCLTFEEDSALYIKLCKGKVIRNQDQEIAHYEEVWHYLESHGFAHYEISNFCRQGKACQHNINTWSMGEWIGIGPAASSQYRQKRYTNIPDLKSWIKGIRENRPVRIDEQALDATVLFQDSLIFGLRMPQGVSLEWLQRRFPAAAWNDLDRLCQSLRENQLMEPDKHFLRLSPKGLMLADAVGVEILRTL